ncbi:MFS transporter [Novosphingobium piscinae]|uniref:MFS transporter n=1 Tax=Novosphingobium piscinae TaxID=1507448 RepID=A0A7X1KQK6_9SPHN|nr:MFS transporter [Novosphingobium piscinae]MBC2669836.1 MFS transporter [Novosphingobium piscinae]
MPSSTAGGATGDEQQDHAGPAHLPLRDSRAGWVVVVAAMIGLGLGLSPMPFYTIGMFAPELQKEFGWSFAALMGSITVQSLVVMVTGPLAGLAVDRYGARPVALVSTVLFGLCYMSLALSGGNLWLYYAQWVVMSTLGAGTLTATWTYTVNGWFEKHRGLALGVASTGTGITGFLIKPFAAWLIGAYGWRTAFAVIGALPIVIGLPVLVLLFRERAQRRRAGPRPGGAQPGPAAAEEAGLTLREALRHRSFRVMALAFLLMAFALTAPTPNLENILRTQHFALPQIGAITAGFGLSVIAGRVIGGWLLDRFWAPGCGVVVLIAPLIGNWLLARPTIDASTATAAVVTLGLGAGFEFDLLAYLIARYFGRRAYGTIYGCFYTVIAFGGGIGPVVYGRVFDVTGRYDLALQAGMVCLVAGSLVLLLMGPYPDWREPAAAPADRLTRGV